MSRRKVELLAPAGSYESMAAAVNAGADAVYIGGSRFGARAYADNPDEDTLVKAIHFAHLHGRRLYMTVNTLVKEGELSQLSPFLRPYYEAGLDAVIVQDLGVFSHIRSRFPDLPVHVSTQMTVTGECGAKMLREMGAARVVPARELSLKEIRAIYDATGMEIETFVHGALCYCYSGQCLFSSLIGGRSGNRGRCAQTCRLPFEVKRAGKSLNRKDEKYVLSMKDLCTLDILPDILEAGVCSLKIEGRMKSPRYTAGVVSIYRKYVDLLLERGREGYRVEEKDRRALLDLFDRGGQTEGYYRKKNGRDMVALGEKPAFREANQALYDYLDRTFVEGGERIMVEGEAWVAPNSPLRLSVTADQVFTRDGKARAVGIIATGEPAEEAKSAPVTEEKIRKQLEKTGNSPFAFRKLTIHGEDGAFVPVQALNRLRREALEGLELAIVQADFRKTEVGGGGSRDAETETFEPGRGAAGGRTSGAGGQKPEFTALVATEEQFKAAVRTLNRLCPGGAGASGVPARGIYLASETFGPETWADRAASCHESGIRCYLMMPRIFRSGAKEYFLANGETLLGAGFDALGAASVEEPQFIRENFPGIPVYFDHGLYAFNHLAAACLFRMGAGRITIPVELNRREIEAAGLCGELIVYGRLPMMVSAQCLKCTEEGCDGREELLYLRDRMGKEFPVVNRCRFCSNTIYNSSPQSLLGLSPEVGRLKPEAIRMNFTVESGEETAAVMEAFYGEYILSQETTAPFSDYTRGHFKRGVE